MSWQLVPRAAAFCADIVEIRFSGPFFTPRRKYPGGRNEVVTWPYPCVPEIRKDVEWTRLCLLPRAAVDPATKSPAGNLWANGRVWAALGLLLTAKTIGQARDLSRERDGGFFFDPAD